MRITNLVVHNVAEMATCIGIQVNTYDVNNKIVSSDPVTSIVDMGVTSGNKTIAIKGGAIQANMDVRDLSYFDAKLKKDEAYKILNFHCEIIWDVFNESETLYALEVMSQSGLHE
nr:hypothetical protein [Tanacetum cinerariifolium]